MRRAARMVLMLFAGAAGVGLAVLAGVAIAKSFTLTVAKNATLTSLLSPDPGQAKTENIVTGANGLALYTLSGDSKRHPKCTKANGCFGFWPPDTAPSGKHPTKAAGIKGKLGTWKRDGFTQVTLAGHPLYFFSGDSHKKHATGQGINSFHGTWSVIALGGSHGSSTSTPTAPTPTAPTPTGTTPTTPTTPYPTSTTPYPTSTTPYPTS